VGWRGPRVGRWGRQVPVYDPPPAIVPAPREPLAPILDRWVAKRFSLDEVLLLMELEHEAGKQAVAEWFDSVVSEAGLAS
jgi:hypothetical protein